MIMKKGNFIFKKVFLAAALVVGLFTGMGTLQVQAAAHSQTECVNWAKAQINKGLDYDGMYGNQCVDLIKYYYQYLGYANYANGNACAYAYNNLPPGWTRVYSNFQPGDIAVWKVNHSCRTCSTSSLGHVGIITSADSVGFNAVNQNFNNQAYCTENWFNCSALQCAIRPDFTSAPAPSNPSTSNTWTASASDITYTNAKLSATITTSSSVQFQWAGCNIYDMNGNEIAKAGENTSVKGTYMNIWYDINAETWNHIQLTPGTTYQYQFYATYGGKDYFSPMYKFTTKQQIINVSGISLNQTSKTLNIGESFRLSATISPSNATDKNMTWSVNNPSVATVSNGTVTAKGAGTAIVTVKSNDGGKTAACQIYVPEPTSDYDDNSDNTSNENVYVAPTSLKTVKNVAAGVQLNWNKVYAASGYEIYRKVNNGNYSLYKTINSENVVLYQDKNVKNGNSYSYKVVTFDRIDGRVYRSTASNVKKTCYLKKYAIKSATNLWTRRAKITWTRNKAASGYEIQYTIGSSFTNCKKATVKGSTNVTKTFSWLAKGKTYSVRVRSYKYVDGVKYYSGWSDVKHVKISK